MAKEEVKPSKEVQEKIAEACKEVVMQDEVIKEKQQSEQQLTQAKQQSVFWDTKVKVLSGYVAAYNRILAKSQKVKTLELASDNTKPEKK